MKLLFTHTLLVLLSVICVTCAQWWKCPDKYKQYSKNHSYCLRTCCSCPYIKKGVSDGLKNAILFYHNSYRSKVAGGNSYGVDHLNRATNMLEMVWDDELATIAQQWAYSCNRANDCDLCRMVDRFPVAQFRMEYEGSFDEKDVEMEFFSYFNALGYLKKEHLASYNEADGKGKYTQFLWAKTWRIGCGFLRFYGDESRVYNHLVCNYGPAGNIDGDEVYRSGPACSACPGNSCCGKDCDKHGIKAKYHGLCKVIDENKSPYGNVPVSKTGNQVFYCGFNGESDCNYIADGIDVWSIRSSTGGSRLFGVLQSGWTSTLTFTSPIKTKSGDVCIKVITRKGPTSADDEYKYEMMGKLEKENRYMTFLEFPKVDEKTKHRYQADYIQAKEYPKDEDIKLTLMFRVPHGAPAQYVEIDEIVAEEKKCRKTTTREGSGYVVFPSDSH